MAAFHVAVDARTAIEDTRGIGRIVRAMLHRLALNDAVALTLVAGGFFRNRVRRRLELAIDSPRFRLARRVPRRAQVLWHPANGTFLKTAVPAVATIHDAGPFRYPNADAAHARRDQAPFLRSVATAKHFIADSSFGAGEIHSVFAVPRERITVIYPGLDTPLPEKSDAAAEALRPFVLYVGTMEHRKGVDLLARAMSLVQKQRPELTLVATGKVHPEQFAPVRAHTLGFVDDAKLAALYRACTLFAFPSRYEGFGLPILEAMSYGAPVVTCSASAMPEAAGDAAHYVPPDDPVALADAIARIASDAAYADLLRARGFERAREFSWERSAAEHLALFRRVAAR